MKKKVIKKIVPAYEMTHTTYQCEGCGAELEFEGSIRECEICGKEVCPKCSTYLDIVKDELIYEGEDNYLRSNSDESFKTYIKVCPECHNKLQSKSNTYKVYLKHIIDEFNINLYKLNDKYIKGEL